MNSESLITFIERYKAHSCLWDVSHVDYMNKNKRISAQEDLIPLLGEAATIDTVRKKIHVLRNCYSRELKKIKASTRTGTDNYSPNLWYFDRLSFLSEREVSRSGVDNNNEQDNVNSDLEHNEQVEVAQDVSSNTESIDKKPNNTKNEANKNNRKLEHRIEHAVLKKISAEPEQVEDVCNLYTKLLCSKLKTMDQMTREIAMHEIDNLMFRLKQQHPSLPQALPLFPGAFYQPNVGFQTFPAAYSYQKNMQSSVGFQTSPYQSLPQSHSQQFTYLQPPQSYSQPHTNFQQSPQSHSQQSADFQPPPQSHSQQSVDFQPSPQSHSQQSADFQPSPQSHSHQSADFQPSPQSHSQQSADFQPSPQSHSQQSADFQPLPQSHSQQSADFQPSPQTHSQCSDLEDVTYSHSQPFPGFLNEVDKLVNE